MDVSTLPIVVISALIGAIVAALATLYVATRLGLRWAIGLPVVALGVYLLMAWRTVGMAFDDGLWFVLVAALFALPVLAGAAVGLLLHFRRRRARKT